MYSIRDLAEEFNVTPRALRYYESLGLLAPERQGVKRFYDHRQYARLSLICRGRRLGFSLSDIKEFLKLYNLKGQKNNQMHFLYEKAKIRMLDLEAQKEDIELTLKELAIIQKELETHLNLSKRR